MVIDLPAGPEPLRRGERCRCLHSAQHLLEQLQTHRVPKRSKGFRGLRPVELE
jgi:hypothetical protein